MTALFGAGRGAGVCAGRWAAQYASRLAAASARARSFLRATTPAFAWAKSSGVQPAKQEIGGCTKGGEHIPLK